MKKMLSILVCGLMFMGFSWSSTEGQTTSTVKKQVEKKTYGYAAPKTAQAVPASTNVQAVTAASKFLGSGSPEEQKARIESLKRLTEAMENSRNKKK